jgi:hypothetical protein
MKILFFILKLWGLVWGRIVFLKWSKNHLRIEYIWAVSSLHIYSFSTSKLRFLLYMLFTNRYERVCYAKIFISRIKLNLMKINGKGKLSLNNLDELRVSCMIMVGRGGLAIGTLAVINGLWATNQFPNRWWLMMKHEVILYEWIPPLFRYLINKINLQVNETRMQKIILLKFSLSWLIDPRLESG